MARVSRVIEDDVSSPDLSLGVPDPAGTTLVTTKPKSRRREGTERSDTVGWNSARRMVMVLALAFVLGAIGYSAVPFRVDVPKGRSGQCAPAALAIVTQGDADSQTGSWLKYGYCANAAKARLATSGAIAALAIVFAAGASRVLRMPEEEHAVLVG
jgi:hypothetical protein